MTKRNRMVDRDMHNNVWHKGPRITNMLRNDCRWCDRERNDGLTLCDVVEPLLWDTWEARLRNIAIWNSGNTEWTMWM